LEVHGDLHGKWDPARIQQIVANLVVNALRYGAPKRPIHIVLSGLAQEIVFSVENEGAAIPPATLAQMFDPLKRGANQPDVEGSLGLGLYICREITLAHGGSIAVQSTDAQTRFAVRLPRNRLDPAASAGQAASGIPAS
jgi:signal transduction histidine kinase